MRITKLALIACGALLGHLLVVPAFAQNAQGQPAPQAQQPPQTPQQRAALLKEWLQFSANQIRAYEWTETTVVSKDGQEKSRTVKRCYYGPDGTLQKVVLQTTPEKAGGPPGILPLGRLAKKAAEHKKEEATDYMKNATALVHQYIPPAPGLIQQSINNGKMGMQVLEPNRRTRLTFGDFLKPGDSLGIEIELPTNRLLAMSVASYLDTAADAVAMNVAMSVMQDGTIYVARSVLDARTKGLSVTVENSGHRRIAP